MADYGQFCAMARAHEALGGRWTLLIVRELLFGSRRFTEFQRGIPRISRSVLSERLQALVLLGAVVREEGASGPEYSLTPAGHDLAPLINSFATWGQRWLPRVTSEEDLDLEPLLIDMCRRARLDALPKHPLAIRFEMTVHRNPRFLLLTRNEASLCDHNKGFPEPVTVRGPLSALAAWWRGDMSFGEARRAGLIVDGDRSSAKDFPDWFERYLFSHVDSLVQRPLAIERV